MDREAEALRGRTWVTRSAAETEALGAAVGRALTGGAVLVGLQRLRRRVHEETPLSRCLCGAACITAAEYVVGCTVNRHFRLRVWDYSHEFGNVQGQICPKYAVLWTLLAAPIMLPK